MADDADITAARMEREEALMKPAPFELVLTQGECMDCGEHAPLVGSICKPCREDAERRAR